MVVSISGAARCTVGRASASYLTWGDVGTDGAFEMFRREKLMLSQVDTQLSAQAVDGGSLLARVDLDGRWGWTPLRRVDPPAVESSAASPA